LIKILAIGDTANVISTLKKIIKQSQIDQIQFKIQNNTETIEQNYFKFFTSEKITEQYLQHVSNPLFDYLNQK